MLDAVFGRIAGGLTLETKSKSNGAARNRHRVAFLRLAPMSVWRRLIFERLIRQLFVMGRKIVHQDGCLRASHLDSQRVHSRRAGEPVFRIAYHGGSIVNYSSSIRPKLEND
jgi:hypothetical protein